MNKNLLLIGGGIAALLYYVGGKAFAAKNARFSFENLDVNLKKKSLIVSFGISNVADQTFTLNALAGDLLLNGNAIANMSSFTKQVVAPKSKSIIKLDLKPSGVGIVQTLFALWKSKFKNSSLVFSGAANIENLQIPFTTTLYGK